MLLSGGPKAGCSPKPSTAGCCCWPGCGCCSMPSARKSSSPWGTGAAGAAGVGTACAKAAARFQDIEGTRQASQRTSPRGLWFCTSMRAPDTYVRSAVGISCKLYEPRRVAVTY